MTSILTYYDILEVAETASQEAIKGAYKYLSQKWHPDKNPDNRDDAVLISQGLRVIGSCCCMLVTGLSSLCAATREDSSMCLMAMPKVTESTEAAMAEVMATWTVDQPSVFNSLRKRLTEGVRKDRSNSSARLSVRHWCWVNGARRSTVNPTPHASVDQRRLNGWVPVNSS